MAALSSVIAESNLDLLMRTSQAGDRGDRGELRLWGAHAERGLNGRISDAEADEENWGLSYQHSRSLRFGGGLRSTSLDGDLPAFDGEADIETFALQGFAAFEPGDEGLQVYVGVLVGTSESAIARGYLNGVTPVWSAGERDGRAFAASVIAAWRFAIADNAQATPFIRLDATHIELDAYTEAGGPFPATFDKLEDTIEASRIGVDGRLDLRHDLRADASLAWGHRMDGRLPTITGEVIGLTAFAVPGAELDRDWAEAHGSLTWSATPGVNLRLGVGASTDGDTAPTLSGVIGIDMRF